MISIEESRKKLGKFAINKTDAEIEEIRNKLYSLSEIIVETISIKKK